jgi:hypothetical protein
MLSVHGQATEKNQPLDSLAGRLGRTGILGMAFLSRTSLHRRRTQRLGQRKEEEKKREEEKKSKRRGQRQFWDMKV